MAATARRTQDKGFIAADEPRGAPIDLVALTRKSMGDREAERALLLQFDRLASQCRDALSRPGSGEGALAALRGAARLIGAGAVATAAENCQHAARAGLHDADSVDALFAAIGDARDFLRELLA